MRDKQPTGSISIPTDQATQGGGESVATNPKLREFADQLLENGLAPRGQIELPQAPDGLVLGAAARPNQFSRAEYTSIYVSPDEVVDLRSLGPYGEISFDVADRLGSNPALTDLANKARDHMANGRVSWGRCAAWVRDQLAASGPAAPIDYLTNGFAYRGPGAADVAEAMRASPNFVEVSPPPGQQFLTEAQLASLPDGAIIFCQRNGETVSSDLSDATWYGHIGIKSGNTLVSDGWSSGSFDVYGRYGGSHSYLAFIPIPPNQETLAAARPLPQFSGPELDNLNAQLARGEIPAPELGARSDLIGSTQSQVKWAQLVLREEYGDNPLVAQRLQQLDLDLPISGVYDQRTIEAVDSFRTAFGLPPGGIDAAFRDTLNAFIAAHHSQPERFPSSEIAREFVNSWVAAASSVIVAEGR